MTDSPELLPPRRAARLLGLTTDALRKLRTESADPPPVALTTPGGQRRYDRAALLAWNARRPGREFSRDPATGRFT